MDPVETLKERIGDYIARAERGDVASSQFLDMASAKAAEEILRQQGYANGREYILFGGYPDAERRMLFLFPDYLRGIYSDPDEQRAFLEQEARTSERLTAVRIDGSGYRALSHRDYLGSLMGLGIERPVVGDIVPYGPGSAAVFFCGKIADYVLLSLERIGADKVRCRSLTQELTDGTLTVTRIQEFREIRDTVASLRLDCVVASLLNLSREKAQTLIRAGTVEVDYTPCDKTDYTLPVPCTFSVRGFGKYRLESTDGETKKGRIRIFGKKYV